MYDRLNRASRPTARDECRSETESDRIGIDVPGEIVAHDVEMVTGPGFGGPRVLLVEDDVLVRGYFQLLLSRLPVGEVSCAADGIAARQLLLDGPGAFDLVISDWRMPLMDGLALLEFVRKVHPDLPFVMMTGNADPMGEATARAAGASAFLAKPVLPETMSATLERLFGD